MQLHAHDFIQSVESVEGGQVRVVAVLPFSAYEDVILLAEHMIYLARFLRTRSQVARASLSGLNVVNEELSHVS